MHNYINYTPIASFQPRNLFFYYLKKIFLSLNVPCGPHILSSRPRLARGF